MKKHHYLPKKEVEWNGPKSALLEQQGKVEGYPASE